MTFLGKGVTFDAGGLQIKPDDGMLDMKMDMAGAAAVVGAMYALDMQDGVDVVGMVGLTENLLGGSAQRPLDIVQAVSGKTVEIRHTDAEGRLVLGDLVGLAARIYNPKEMTSIATLTGACMHALGYDYAGLMSRNHSLARRIESASLSSGDPVWRLPLDDAMDDAVKSHIADLSNHTPGFKAGASMGAAFIAAHAPKSTAYAHLDIAGPAYRAKARGPHPDGASGYGVRLLRDLGMRS
jgi:leucyl aminopeptidase